MADLTTLHKSARTLILSLREGMEQLERAETGGTFVHESSLKKTQTQRLADLQSISERMDSAWRMQSMRESAAKCDVWRRKVEQVSEEVMFLQQALDKHLQREGRRNAEARERAELLSRRSGQAGPSYAGGGWGARFCAFADWLAIKNVEAQGWGL
ncbi:hypothetical protein WJX84_009729 [Apatococcus fuscideae]|uniref:Uncharacterized protein n=1 Tax=Apatococcus fuscideae TaxID=2026836 RepID=A0AAW1SVL1_9CHLO